MKEQRNLEPLSGWEKLEQLSVCARMYSKYALSKKERQDVNFHLTKIKKQTKQNPALAKQN